MDISIIIVNYNQKYFPRMCIEAIERSKTNLKYEIIVVDNNSKDESIKFLDKAGKEKRIVLIKNKENLGFGVANNIGAKVAKGKYLIILNPDVKINDDTINKLFEYHKNNKEIGILAPRLHYYNGQIQESCRRFPNFWIQIIRRTPFIHLPCFKKMNNYYVMKNYNHSRIMSVDVVTGAFMLISKKLFKEVGGFDERYFLFMEDIDLCKKIINLNKKIVYYPKVSVLHNHKRLSQGNFFILVFKKTTWYHLFSAIKYYWKWK